MRTGFDGYACWAEAGTGHPAAAIAANSMNANVRIIECADDHLPERRGWRRAYSPRMRPISAT